MLIPRITAITLGLAASALAIDATSAIQTDKAAKAKKYGPYVGAFGGVTQGQSAVVQPAGQNLDVKERSGAAMFGVEVGYSWKTKTIFEPALEFEAFYLGNEISANTTESVFNNYLKAAAQNQRESRTPSNAKSAKVTNTDTAAFIADINAVVFMLNAQISLDFKPLEPWIPDKALARVVTSLKPYAGVGVGGAQLWFRNVENLSYQDLQDAAIEEVGGAREVIGGENVDVRIKPTSDGNGFFRETITIRTDGDGNVLSKSVTSAPHTPTTSFPERPDKGAVVKVEKGPATDVPGLPPGYKQIAYTTTTTYSDGSSKRVTRFELEDRTIDSILKSGTKNKALLNKALRAAYRKKRAAAATANPASGASGLFSEDRFVFAYQWYAGLEIKLNDRASIYGEYRHLTLDKFEPVRDLSNELWNAGVRLRY